MDDDPVEWLRLIRSRRIGPVTFHRLLAEHGSVAEALRALPAIAAAAGGGNYEACPLGVVLAEIRQAKAAGARMLCWGQGDYPKALVDVTHAPPVLWAQGDVSLLARPMVALVGARSASSLGLRMARRLGESLGAAGWVVVSGLARGIDTESHGAALMTGTVAVQAGGVDHIYPLENAKLAEQILEYGCRVSEQPMGMEPQARHFPMRNRIISGLARAVVVVEAAAKSGSLITAECALEQGREVFAVPGHPFDARAGGCNRLIRDGAVLVRGASDIVEVLGGTMVKAEPEVAVPPAGTRFANVTALHNQILSRLGPSPVAEDQLIRDLGVPASVVTPEIVLLELEGRIQRQSGGLLSRLS
ncbi:MAG: DNA-protecting protein DprA [Pseudorhodobacter sp.]|nr:DNA-protecting protein DprA [Pseudorhodobacter sp.]